jgi:hypothetical protein
MFIAAEGWRSSWKGQQKLTQPVEERWAHLPHPDVAQEARHVEVAVRPSPVRTLP